MLRHVFFDLDSTLTPSRALMRAPHVPLFERLCAQCDVIVVTGQKEDQILNQIPVEHTGNYYIMSQQGNYVVGKDGSLLWHETVTPAQEAVVRPFALQLTEEFVAMKQLAIPDRKDIFENRGGQFAASVLGFHAPNELKYAVDPDQSIRRGLLAKHPDEIKALRAVGIEDMPAGTTTFDFILLGKNKGSNIARLIEHEGWQKDECLYLGDALFKGGNDESVIGIIPTRAVKDPDDTFDFIKNSVLSS